MHDGVIPGSFTANVLTRVPNVKDYGSEDMKKQNRRNAPERKTRPSFLRWLQARAEEEEKILSNLDDLDDDELDDEELDDIDDEELPDEEYDDSPCYDEDDLDDEDPQEFDDFDEEKELDFEDDDRAPFPVTRGNRFKDFYNGDDDEGGEESRAGRLTDFYRMDGEEEQEENAPGGFEPGQALGTIGGMGSNVPKIERARILMRQLINKPGITRDDIIEEFKRRLPTTDSTAISYYEDIAREMGLTGHADEDLSAAAGDGEDEMAGEMPGEETAMTMPQEEIDAQDPNAQGMIRTVPKAHLVFKRQQGDGKFEELWVFNLGDKIHDALNIRREILSGTDIPRGHTRSEDGNQSYTLQTMGNAQLMHITGLAN